MSVGVGDRAPAFTLPGTGGRSYSLADFAGRPVVLVFYPGDDTPVCTKQLNSYNDGLEQFDELDAQVLGISAQDVDSHDRFSGKHGFDFPLLADTDKAVAAAYGTLGPIGFPRRSVFIVDGERHRPLRPPGHRRADLPSGQRARRRPPGRSPSPAGIRPPSGGDPLACEPVFAATVARTRGAGHRPRADPLRLRRARRPPGGATPRAVALGVIRTPPATRCRSAWPSCAASWPR